MTHPMPWWVVPSLAGCVLLIFAGALIGACLYGDNGLRNVMMGQAGILASGVVAFYFGSSNSSQRKDETIARAASDLGQSAPVKTEYPTTEAHGKLDIPIEDKP